MTATATASGASAAPLTGVGGVPVLWPAGPVPAYVPARGPVATPVVAWFTWRNTERALRLGRPLPSPAMAVPLSIMGATTTVLILFGVLLR